MDQRRAIVTGGSAGIGTTIALALARANCSVAILDIDLPAAQELVAQIHRAGGQALTLPASVTDPSQVREAFLKVDREWGGIDILINNAGITVNKPSVDVSIDEWRRVLDVNLTGVFLCSQQAAQRMIPQGSGSIINLGSIYSVVAAPNRAAYCATKAGVAMLTKSLAIEWAASGVRVNAVAPGYVQTAFTDELERQGVLDLEAVSRRTPMKRLAKRDEIADAVLFLASEKAAFITGQIIGVDGGWTAYGYL